MNGLSGAPSVMMIGADGPTSFREARSLFVLGALLLVIGCVALALQLDDFYEGHIAALVVQSFAYALAVWLVARRGVHIPLWFVIAIALALRLGPLLMAPYLSTDIFRYIWDGRVQGAGINPYLYVPNDNALAVLRDARIWPLINRAAYARTIYPPGAEMLFFLATRIAGTVVWMKTFFVLFEAATVWALVRLLDAEGLPRERVLIYAWCPLCVWEFAGSGHVDAAMTTFVILAILACRRAAPVAAGVALGFAVLVKFFPLLLFPALWRRWDWRMPVAMATTIILSYLVYLKAGWAIFGFLSGYVSEEGLDDGSGFWLLDTVSDAIDVEIPAWPYIVLAALVLAGLALFVVMRPPGRRSLYANALLLASGGMFALSPNYPWYFGWLVPMLCLVPLSWPLLWLVASGFLLYFSDWSDDIWTPNIVYGGVAALLAASGAYHLFQRLRRPAPS